MSVKIDSANYKLLKFIEAQKSIEGNTSILKRKKNGIFFTNNINIIDSILDNLPGNDKLFSKMVLEPSCGHGIFILKLLLKLYTIKPCPDTISEFINSRLYFTDIDPKMILQTEDKIKKFFIFLFNKEFKSKFNSYSLDFTIKKNNQPTELQQNFFSNYKSFDYIIGNPPYVSLYGRRDKKKNEEQRVYYLKNYKQFPKTLTNGKINYVMLFIEHGVNFLKPGGLLSFIIDVSFFETAFKYCRKYLLDNTKIKQIIYNVKGFDNVASGQVLLSIVKEKIKSNNVITLDSISKSEYYINQHDWDNENDEYKFRLKNKTIYKSILDKIILKGDKTLKQLYPDKNLRTCVMPLNMEDQFTTNNKPKIKEHRYYPYYQGSQGLKSKYSKMNSIKFFIYNKELQDRINNELKEELTKKGIKNKKRIGLGETIIYDNPKLYIRQSAKELIASYDKFPSAANNSLYIFSLRNNSKSSIYFLKLLCGLLNSKVYTFFAQQRRIIRYNTGKQPQIKISDLYQITIPADKNLKDKIVNFVNKIYENPDNIKIQKQNINNLLYKYYELTKNEVISIEKSIKE